VLFYRQRDVDVTIYDHTPTAEEDPYADSGIYEAIVHKLKVHCNCSSIPFLIFNLCIDFHTTTTKVDSRCGRKEKIYSP